MTLASAWGNPHDLQAAAPASDDCMNNPSRPSRRRRRAIAATVAVLFLVLYVLSIGPAARLLNDGVIPPRTFVTVYKPISLISKYNKSIADWLNWYCLAWIPEEGANADR
jgi:hypothetical protein